MAARVEDTKNDTKAITQAAKELGQQVSSLEKLLASIKKSQAAITKKPDECKDAAQQVMSDITEFMAEAKDLKSSVDALKKVAK